MSGVKRFDPDGKLIGEFRIVGLFTSTAYTRSTRTIPYLRRKVDAVIERAGFDPDGHSGKALVNVLENYPRDELFQIDEDTLYQFALAVLQLDERPRVRVLPRRDRFDRFVSVLGLRAARPLRQRRAQGDRRLSRRRLQGPRQRLPSVLPGRAAGARAFHHRPLRGRQPEPRSRQPRSARSRRSCAPGSTSSATSLRAHYDAGEARALLRALSRRLLGGLSRGLFAGDRASATSASSRGCRRAARSASTFIAAPPTHGSCVGLKVWSYDRPIPLSERVPVLENMGFRVVDERTYQIDRRPQRCRKATRAMSGFTT